MRILSVTAFPFLKTKVYEVNRANVIEILNSCKIVGREENW